MTDKSLTVEEAANFLSINPWQVREYVRRGLLPRQYATIDNHTRLMFQEEDLKCFLNKNNPKKKEMGKLLTVNEAADFLSVNPWQVRDYITNGQLRAYKMGNGTGKRGNKRRWRIWKEDLIAFINRGSNIKEGK